MALGLGASWPDGVGLVPQEPQHLVSAHLGPGVLLAEQVGIEVGHLPLALVGEAPHQLPVAHVVELLPVLLGLTALLEPLDGLRAPAGQPHGPTTLPHSIASPASSSAQWSSPVPGSGKESRQEFWAPGLVLLTKSYRMSLGPVTAPPWDSSLPTQNERMGWSCNGRTGGSGKY